jgi:hypothetical protein
VTATEFVPTLEALERDEGPMVTIEPTDIAPIDPRLDPSLFAPLVTSVEVEMPADEVTQPLVILDYFIDPEVRLFDGIDTSKEPIFNVSEAAKFFFRRSPHWLRLQENLCVKCRNPWRTDDPNVCPQDGEEHDIGLIRIDGVKVSPPRTEGNARYYTLADIENTARGLYEQRVIDKNQLSFALAIARIQGRLWDYL